MPYSDPQRQAAALIESDARRRRNMSALLYHARRCGWANLAELAEALNAGAVKLPKKPRAEKEQVTK